jgi:hypothetical protein
LFTQEEIMNSNFEWQKQHANERVQGALRDAAAYRLSNERSRTRSFGSTSSKAALLLGIVWFLIGLLLSGCVSTETAHAEQTSSDASGSSQISKALTMADRIRFQDRQWEQALASGQSKPQRSNHLMTMADRIRFKELVLDRNESARTTGRSPQKSPAWSIADKIKFHDRLGK